MHTAQGKSRLVAVCAALLLATGSGNTHSAEFNSDALPAIAIVLDDIGNRRAESLRALELPGSLSYAFLPHTPYARSLAEIAHQLGKDVLLHLPMDADRGEALGPGGISVDMSKQEITLTVARSLAAIPHAIGVSNHMGSLLTRNRQQMTWLMQALKHRPRILFLDSRTTGRTVAAEIAREAGIPTLERDIFLDNEQREESIRSQLRQLVRRARQRGSAIAIGHPYPETIDVLREFLPRLDELGVRLLRITKIAEHRSEFAALQTAER